MNASVGAASAPPLAVPRARAVSWAAAATVLAATSAVVGVLWDISWHRTIGRDTFWTPAHLAIYLGGVVAGVACGWLVLRITFVGTPEQRAAGVSFWGFRGPLGAWVAIWGAIAMITSAPFDNWWHNAYGLDVEILSPPHAVLALGIVTLQLGAMLLVLARQNAAPPGAEQPAARRMFAYTAGIVVVMVAVMATEYIAMPNRMHGSLFYKVSAGIFPLLLLGAARASRLAWPATTVAAIYVGLNLGMNWTLALFPARPLLAPILNPVTHMVPYPFPMLLVVPAFGLDLLLRRLRGRSDWLQAAVLGVAFVALLVAVQWFFAEFMLTPAARNWFFTADRWDYSSRLGPWRYQWWDGDPSVSAFATGLAVAVGIAFVSARIGLAWGNWLARVKR